MNRFSMVVLAAAVAAFSPAARADDAQQLELGLKGHIFNPPELKAKAGKDIVITLKNEDDTVEEFDSDALHTEKIVTGSGTITIKLRGLAAGSYPFQGENHAETAKGVLIVE
jgi:hypothetical protein